MNWNCITEKQNYFINRKERKIYIQSSKSSTSLSLFSGLYFLKSLALKLWRSIKEIRLFSPQPKENQKGIWNQVLINTQSTYPSTLSQHLHWYMVNTYGNQHLGWQLTNFRRHHMNWYTSQSTLCQLSPVFQLSVDQDVDGKYWSRLYCKCS